MNDDTPLFLFAGFVVLVFFGGLGALAYSDHVQRMECFERGGVPVNGICINRPSLIE